MKLHLDQLLIRMLMLCLVGIVALQTLGYAGFASVLFTMTFVLTAALWLCAAAVGIGKCNQLVIWILLLSAGAVCWNALLTGTLVSGSYFKKLILFWTAVLCFGAVADWAPSRRTVCFVFRCNTILAIFLVGVYLLRTEQMYQINQIVTIYLTFGFTNPNLAAAFLSAICTMELIRWKTLGKSAGRFLHLLLGGILVFFVFETRARNAQMMLSVFLVVVSLLNLFPRWRPYFGKWLAVLLSWLPLLFAVAYLLLIYVPAVQRTFSFLAGEGKGLDSRLVIWKFAVESVARSPLTGAYSQISGGTGASQMHNTHLDILASYGAPVLVLTCRLLAALLYGDGRTGRNAFLCRVGFGAMLLSGMGEAMLFSGGMGICLYAGMLLMLTRFPFEEEEAL